MKRTSEQVEIFNEADVDPGEASPAKRVRDTETTNKKKDKTTTSPAPKSSVPDRIRVLHGFWNDRDDFPPIVKYWDPDLCLDPALRLRLEKMFDKPIEDRGLFYYLLSGDDCGEDEIDEAFLAHTPEELGVRKFKHNIISVDLDF